MVQRNIPLAKQIVEEILSGIDSGELAGVGGMLPSETELSHIFGVSRATVREALAQLDQRGIISRRQGIGTFVARSPLLIDAGMEELESINTLARRIGLQTHYSDISIKMRAANGEEAASLQVVPGTQVFDISRVICSGANRIAYLIDVVPASYLSPQELEDPFDGSVLDIFLRRGEPALSHSRTVLMAETACKDIALKLNLKPGSTLLRLEAQLFARDGRVLDCSRSYFVTEYFRFHIIRRIGTHL